MYYGCIIAPVEEGEIEPGGAVVRHQCVISINQESWRVSTLRRHLVYICNITAGVWGWKEVFSGF